LTASSQSKVNYHYMEGEITLTLSLSKSQAILKRVNTKTGYNYCPTLQYI